MIGKLKTAAKFTCGGWRSGVVMYKATFAGVHCTHGYNRTGFLIIAYLVEKQDWRYVVACLKRLKWLHSDNVAWNRYFPSRPVLFVSFLIRVMTRQIVLLIQRGGSCPSIRASASSRHLQGRLSVRVVQALRRSCWHTTCSTAAWLVLRYKLFTIVFWPYFTSGKKRGGCHGCANCGK